MSCPVTESDETPVHFVQGGIAGAPGPLVNISASSSPSQLALSMRCTLEPLGQNLPRYAL